jgi:hydrogenase maturation factor
MEKKMNNDIDNTYNRAGNNVYDLRLAKNALEKFVSAAKNNNIMLAHTEREAAEWREIATVLYNVLIVTGEYTAQEAAEMYQSALNKYGNTKKSQD